MQKSSEVIIVTVDGPGGSGKGTVSGLLASAFGWNLLDSGALYRLTALSAQRQCMSFDDVTAISKVAQTLEAEFVAFDACQSDFAGSLVTNDIYLVGERVTDLIRTEEIGALASKVAVLPSVRKALLSRQRAFAKPPGLVADGRDMGTVVFPEAQVKIFLEASIKKRASRRWKQLQLQGLDVSLNALEGEIAERDKRDSERSSAPLRPAAGAVIIDSTDLSVFEVFKRVLLALKEQGIASD